MRLRTSARWLFMALLGLGLGCSNTSGPVIRPPNQLNVVRLQPTHPPFFNDSVAFYAKKGQGIEGAISFQDPQGAKGQDFLRLKLDAASLLQLPDGTPVVTGDSVLIIVKVGTADSILFTFEPGGLVLDPAHPAELKIEYAEAGGDFNGNGTSGDSGDQQIEHQLAIWRQPLLTDPFTQLGSVRTESQKKIEATLTGFSRYAIAY